MTKYFWLIGAFLLIAMACKRNGDEIGNNAPETKMVVDAINLTGDDRLNSVVTLSWIGTDNDGFIVGYNVSIDNINWTFTTETDSTFRFELDAGSDSTDIDLYVQAVDNERNTDPTPAYLRIPLKNTPPVATFNDDSFPEDTTLIVTTFEWSATDIDGDESIVQAFIKINDGDWYEIDKNQARISIAPINASATGSTDAFVYYSTSSTPEDNPINGLRIGDTNIFYIKVADLANSESEPDTSAAIFVRPKTSDLLLIAGQSSLVRGEYESLVGNTYGSYDLLDYERNSGADQPKYWAPTFDLILSRYDKLVQFGDGTTFTNPINGQKDILLGFTAPFIQDFSTNGGKSFIINSFSSNNDVSNIATIMPFDSLSSSGGQAIFQTDSSLVPVYNTLAYPAMAPASILLGMDPFYPTADATTMYIGELEASGSWVGPNVMGAGRLNGSNQLYQVFFTAPIHQFDTQVEREALFNQILNNEFNW